MIKYCNNNNKKKTLLIITLTKKYNLNPARLSSRFIYCLELVSLFRDV